MAHNTGRLAEIIVLDQFSRNLFRDRPEAFACDGMALALAQEALRIGADQTLPTTRRAFMYLTCTANRALFTPSPNACFASPAWTPT